jgi:hypothetical protein
VLLLVMVIALTGGIIWYKTKKSNQLAVAAAERMMLEAGEDVSNRIRLLYDPMYAIVGIASLVPELTSAAIEEDPARDVAVAPDTQDLSANPFAYVGFDSGEFFMVTHIAGDNSAALRESLHAPPEAAFSNEIISADTDGGVSTR